MSDAIDRYIQRLSVSARVRRVDVARLRDDAEEHLRDAQQDLIQRGMSPDEAARAALAQFGDVRLVAAKIPRRGGSLLLQVLRASCPWLSVGLIAVGLGGVVGLLVAAATGAETAAAASLVQVAAGFVGVSVLESRRRRSATGSNFATPGLSPRIAPIVALATFASFAIAAWGCAVALVAWRRPDHSVGLLATGLALAVAAGWVGHRLRSISSEPALSAL